MCHSSLFITELEELPQPNGVHCLPVLFSLLPSVSHFRELPLSVPLLQAHWVFVCKREGKKKERTSSEKGIA